MPSLLATTVFADIFADFTPALTFAVTCCTLLGIIAVFTNNQFTRFRKNMAADTRTIVKEENKPLIESLAQTNLQIEHLTEGLASAKDMANRAHADLNGRDGLFARVAYIEALNGVKRTEPVGTVHNEVGAT